MKQAKNKKSAAGESPRRHRQTSIKRRSRVTWPWACEAPRGHKWICWTRCCPCPRVEDWAAKPRYSRREFPSPGELRRTSGPGRVCLQWSDSAGRADWSGWSWGCHGFWQPTGRPCSASGWQVWSPTLVDPANIPHSNRPIQSPARTILTYCISWHIPRLVVLLFANTHQLNSELYVKKLFLSRLKTPRPLTRNFYKESNQIAMATTFLASGYLCQLILNYVIVRQLLNFSYLHLARLIFE